MDSTRADEASGFGTDTPRPSMEGGVARRSASMDSTLANEASKSHIMRHSAELLLDDGTVSRQEPKPADQGHLETIAEDSAEDSAAIDGGSSARAVDAREQ